MRKVNMIEKKIASSNSKFLASLILYSVISKKQIVLSLFDFF